MKSPRPSRWKSSARHLSQVLKNSFDHKWLPEYLALVVSLTAIAAVIGILAKYNGSNLATWYFPYNISINAVISTFSTISKGFLAIAVGAGIGQWKWIWFTKKERNLDDFEILDKSSRGPWGSFLMLFRTQGNLPLLLGGMITILSIAVDPFVQQIISIQIIPGPGEENSASIAAASGYAAGFKSVQTAMTPISHRAFADQSMEAAIIQGLSRDQITVKTQFQVQCSSSNCTWDIFSSLGVCGACTNVTSFLKKKLEHDASPQWLDFSLTTNGDSEIAKDLTNYSLPDGNAIWNMDWTQDEYVTAMMARTNFIPSNTLSFTNNDLLLVSMSIINSTFILEANGSLSQWPGSDVQATECGLYFCVQQYKSKVINGVLNEEVTAQPSLRAPGSWVLLSGTSLAPDSLNSIDTSLRNMRTGDDDGYAVRSDLQVMQANNQTNIYNITQVSLDGITSKFGTLFPINDSAVVLHTSDASLVPETSAMKSLFLSTNLSNTFDTIALAMTNELRQSSNPARTILGKTNSSLTVIQVRWGWAALPIALVLLGCLFLSISIWESQRSNVEVWKDSSLATLFHGLDQPLLRDPAQAVTTSDMKHRAKSTTVQLMEVGGKKVLSSPGSAYMMITGQG